MLIGLCYLRNRYVWVPSQPKPLRLVVHLRLRAVQVKQFERGIGQCCLRSIPLG